MKLAQRGQRPEERWTVLQTEVHNGLQEKGGGGTVPQNFSILRPRLVHTSMEAVD